jgi:hypothetical protein
MLQIFSLNNGLNMFHDDSRVTFDGIALALRIICGSSRARIPRSPGSLKSHGNRPVISGDPAAIYASLPGL